MVPFAGRGIRCDRLLYAGFRNTTLASATTLVTTDRDSWLLVFLQERLEARVVAEGETASVAPPSILAPQASWVDLSYEPLQRGHRAKLRLEG
jgi:hypothetical protein